MLFRGQGSQFIESCFFFVFLQNFTNCFVLYFTKFHLGSTGGRGYVKFLKNALQWQLPLLLQQPLLAPNASPDSSSTSTSSSPSFKENGNESDNEDIEVTFDANDVANEASCKTDEGYKSLQEVLYENKVYLQSKVKNCSYYWPKITRVEAEKLLKDQPNGYFLLRDSSDKKVAFCLTYKIFMTDDITSIKMFKTGNGFQFEGDNLVVVEAFESPMELIDHFVNGNEPRSNLNHLKMPFLRRNPLSLKDLSNTVVRESVTYCNIEKLPIPIELQTYIKEN